MHKRRTILALILVATGLVAAVVLLSTNPPRSSSTPGADNTAWSWATPGDRAPLSGRVLDENADPVGDASVEVHSVLGRRVELVAEERTDDHGAFEFLDVPVGFVAIVATAEGYARAVLLVDLHRGGLSEVEITIDEGGSVAGRVVDDVDHPVAGVRVCARSHQVGPVPELEAQCSSTNQEGEFALTNVALGLLAVAVDGEGIASMLRPDVIAPVDSIVLRVNRRGGLGGTVRMPDGRAAADAQVMIAGSGIWPPRLVEVGEDGTYLVEDLPAGVYELEARSEGLVSMRELGVEIRPGRPVTVDLDLEQGVALQGRVLDGRSGEPIADARIVVADDFLSSSPAVGWSGHEGRFMIPGLAPGEHRLSVWAEGRVPVVGRPCLVPSEVEVSLAPEAIISGRVVDERGFPVEGASVEPDLSNPLSPLLVTAPPFTAPPVASPSALISGSGGELGVYPGLEEIDFDVLPSSPSQSADPGVGHGGQASDRSALDLTLMSTATGASSGGVVEQIVSRTKGSWPVTTDRGGEYRLGGLPAGAVVVLASHRAMAPGKSKAITLTPGAHVEDVVIVLRRGTELRGRVVDSRGFPIEAVLINLHSSSTTRQGRLTFSERDGTFSFDGVAGETTLSASHSGYAPVTIALDVPAGATAQEVELTLEEAARTVRGRVLDSRDFPVPNAEVTVRSVTSGAPIVRHALTAEDGTFSVDGMAGGLAVVNARAPGLSPGSVVAEPGTSEVTIWLDRAGALVVEVVDPHSGEAIEECSVAVLGSIGRRLRQACEAGRATFVELPSGPATLWVTASGRAERELEVEVGAGVDPSDPDAFVRVEVPGATIVRGYVYDVDGEPVIGARVSLSRLPRTFTPATRGRWVESGALGRFELEGLELDAAAVVYADHPSLGAGEVEVGPAWPEEEPEVELWLEAPAAPRVRGRHIGVAVDLVARQEGIIVDQVAPGSRAESSGLRRGDFVASISGRQIPTVQEAYRAMRGPRGTALVMTVRRDDEEVVLLIERELVLR